MNNDKIIKILDLILNRMHECQTLPSDKFNSLNTVHYKEQPDGFFLECCNYLFDEHTSLTSLINDVYDLRTSLSKFPSLFVNIDND